METHIPGSADRAAAPEKRASKSEPTNKKKVEDDEDDDFWGTGPWLEADAAAPAGPSQQAVTNPQAHATPTSAQPGGFVIAEQNPFLASAAASGTEWDFEDLDEVPAGQIAAAPAQPPALSPASTPASQIGALPTVQHPSPHLPQPANVAASLPQEHLHSPPLCTQPQLQQPVIQQQALQPQLPTRDAEPDPDSFFDSLAPDTEPALPPQLPSPPVQQHLSHPQLQDPCPAAEAPQQLQQPGPAECGLGEQDAHPAEVPPPQAVSAPDGMGSGLCSPFAQMRLQEQVTGQQQACTAQPLDEQQQQQQQLAGQAGMGGSARHRLATAFYPSPCDALGQQGSLNGETSPADSCAGSQGHSIQPVTSASAVPGASQHDHGGSGNAVGLGADQHGSTSSTSQQIAAEMHAYAEYYAQYYSSLYGADHYSYYYSMCAQQFQLQLEQRQQQGAAAAEQGETHGGTHHPQPQQQHLVQLHQGMVGVEKQQQHEHAHSQAWDPSLAASDHTRSHHAAHAAASSAGTLSSMPQHGTSLLFPPDSYTTPNMPFSLSCGMSGTSSAALPHSSPLLPSAAPGSGATLGTAAYPGHHATAASVPMHAYGTGAAMGAPHSLPAATSSSYHTPLPVPVPALSHADMPQGGLGQGGNLYSKQYNAEHKLHTPGALVDLPSTQQAACSCPNGRPAHPFVSFGFGGSILVVRSRMQAEANWDHAGLHPCPAALLTFTSLPKLHAALMESPHEATVPSANQQAPGSNGHPPFGAGRLISKSVLGVIKGQHHAKQGISDEDPALRVLSAFPGPLGASTNKEAVLKFIADREAAYPVEDPHASLGPEGVGRMIWQTLGLMVKHDGLLKGPLSKKPLQKPGAPTAERELMHVLNNLEGHHPSCGAAENAAGSNHAMAASMPGAASVPPLLGPPQDDMRQQAAAEEVQRLVVQGKQQEAVRVAMQAQLWGIALCLAQGCSEQVMSETATAMAYACLVPGCPLRTLVLLLAGNAEQAVSPHDHSVQEGTMAPGMRDGQGVLLNSWRDNLAVLAGSARSPADLDAIVRLGERLALEGAQVQAAHLCYLVAGLLPSPYDSSSTASAHCKPAGAPAGAAPGGLAHYCLLGVDHLSTPRTYTHPLAIQRTEIFEWARSLVNTGSKPTSMPGHSPSASMPDLTAAAVMGSLPSLLPYKLVHAHMLAEYGRIQDALAYCQALDASFRASTPAGRMSLVGRELEAFKERLLNFAAAHSINVSRSESSITRVGRLLDSTLNKLLWGAHEQAATPTPGQPKRAQEPTPHPRSPTVAYGGPDAPIAPLHLGFGVQSRCSTPGASQVHSTVPTLSRPPSGVVFHPSGCTSHASSTCESLPPWVPGQDVAGQNGTSHLALAPTPTNIPKPSSCSTLTGLESLHAPPFHSRQVSMDTIPPVQLAQPAPQTAANQVDIMSQSTMARSCSSSSLEQSQIAPQASLQHDGNTTATPGLPPLPPKSEERKSRCQATTPGKAAERKGSEAKSSWGLMGILSAGSKRIGSVVAQGKEAVAKPKQEGGGPRQGSLGEEKKSFYYDHEHKKWVIEGEEEQQEEPMPPPPPKLALGPQGLSPPGSPALPQGAAHGALPQGPPPIPSSGVPHVTQTSGPAAPPLSSATQFRRGAGTSRYVDPMFSGSSVPSHQSSSSSVRDLLPAVSGGLLPQAARAQRPAAFFTPSPTHQPQHQTPPAFLPWQKGQGDSPEQQLHGVQESVAESFMGLGYSGKSDEMKEVEL